MFLSDLFLLLFLAYISSMPHSVFCFNFTSSYDSAFASFLFFFLRHDNAFSQPPASTAPTFLHPYSIDFSRRQSFKWLFKDFLSMLNEC